ncbi:MAG: tRNA (mo5U34)-methyltransferase, partial [Patiriisocius sp.]
MPIRRYIEDCFAQTESLAAFHPHLKNQIADFFAERPHGRSAEWDSMLLTLPLPQNSRFDLCAENVSIGDGTSLGEDLADVLKTFKPWRKGPFQLGDLFIDTEWRSDWKWQRIQPHIANLEGRSVLDIGCGNGYHLFRMLGDGASMALGVDPT